MPLWAIVPELILAIFFILLLAASPFFEGRKSVVMYAVLLLALSASAYFTWRMLYWPPTFVFKGTYKLDSFSYFFKFYAIAGTALVALACFDYFRFSKFRSDIPAFLIAATLGCAMLPASMDLSLIVLFFQIIAVSTMILVGITKEDEKSNEAVLKYFLFGAASTAVLVYGLSFLYGLNGSTSIGVQTGGWGIALPSLVLAIALVGFGFKMAVAPFHMWAPDVYQGAPAPISGMLSVLPKVAAVAIVLRILNASMLPVESVWRPALEAIAVVSMTAGNLWALRQPNVKRLLAYSSIAQIGYVTAGIAGSSGGKGGGIAALFYLVVYGFMNLGAFFVVAKIEATQHTSELDAYRGMFKRRPTVALVMTLFLLSLAGVPPMAGYIGKVVLLSATLSYAPWLAVVMAVNFILGLYYYLRVIASMYLQESGEAAPGSHGRQSALDFAIAICCIAVLAIGIFPAPWLHWIQVATPPR